MKENTKTKKKTRKSSCGKPQEPYRPRRNMSKSNMSKSNMSKSNLSEGGGEGYPSAVRGGGSPILAMMGYHNTALGGYTSHILAVRGYPSPVLAGGYPIKEVLPTWDWGTPCLGLGYPLSGTGLPTPGT